MNEQFLIGVLFSDSSLSLLVQFVGPGDVSLHIAAFHTFTYWCPMTVFIPSCLAKHERKLIHIIKACYPGVH